MKAKGIISNKIIAIKKNFQLQKEPTIDSSQSFKHAIQLRNDNIHMVYVRQVDN